MILDRLESDTNINAAMLETGLVTLSSSSPSETASLLSIEDAGRRGGRGLGHMDQSDLVLAECACQSLWQSADSRLCIISSHA